MYREAVDLSQRLRQGHVTILNIEVMIQGFS